MKYVQIMTRRATKDAGDVNCRDVVEIAWGGQ
jgi:hypothetical protein